MENQIKFNCNIYIKMFDHFQMRNILRKLSFFSFIFISAVGCWLCDTPHTVSAAIYIWKSFFVPTKEFIYYKIVRMSRTQRTHQRLTVQIATLSMFKWPISFGHFSVLSMPSDSAMRPWLRNVRHLTFVYLFIYRHSNFQQ